MRVVKGRVVSGNVIVEGEPLAEGAVVTVIVSEDDETFRLGPEGEQALLASIAEAESGETVSGEEVLRRLDGRT
ncbi:MAG: hypothetical protein H0X23_13370 [Rubrobacter sp.]|jgi:hypothetical protein|nr:hypothetical protein [Rubrobacter sp.]MDQ3638596.1 hypothetical protein [Actinomycetota bacterium]